MKKILSCFFALCLAIGFSGCQKESDDLTMVFFDAFHETISADSGHVKGSLRFTNKDESSMNVDLSYIQADDLQLALDLSLMADEQKADDFLSFYIKDGKTFLNYMGTKSQSVASNLGIDTKEPLSVQDPFLNFTDEELSSFFRSTKKKGDTYSYTIDPKKLSVFLDSFGTIDIDSAKLDITLQKNVLKTLKLSILGSQTVLDQSAKIDVVLDLQFEQMNALTSLSFPEDLSSY